MPYPVKIVFLLHETFACVLVFFQSTVETQKFCKIMKTIFRGFQMRGVNPLTQPAFAGEKLHSVSLDLERIISCIIVLLRSPRATTNAPTLSRHEMYIIFLQKNQITHRSRRCRLNWHRRTRWICNTKIIDKSLLVVERHRTRSFSLENRPLFD